MIVFDTRSNVLHTPPRCRLLRTRDGIFLVSETNRDAGASRIISDASARRYPYRTVTRPIGTYSWSVLNQEDRTMQTVELFCGTKSFSSVAARRNHATFTLDIVAAFAPDILGDIRAVSASQLPRNPVVLWASPPCQAFSVAAQYRNWNRDWTPKHPRVIEAQKVVRKTLALISELKPDWWFIENPRGMLRHMPFMRGFRRETVAYCQYGSTVQKPTDIWTNAYWWHPRPVCPQGSPCHDPSPRGARGGTQALRGAMERSRIPAGLFDEIFSQLEARYRSAR